MKTTNSRGTREAGHQSQATQRRKSNLSPRENEKPQKAMRRGLKTKASK